MAKKQKTKKIPLTDEEFQQAVLMRDETEMQIAVTEFNVKQGIRQIELGLPERIARRNLAQHEEELSRQRLNKKYYDKLIREKSREVPDTE